MPVDRLARQQETHRLHRVDPLGRNDDPAALDLPTGAATNAGRRLWLICALLILTTMAAGIGVIWQLRHEAIFNAQRELTNLGTVLAEQTTRTVQSVDLVLQEVQAYVAAPAPTSAEAFRTQFAGEPTRQFLADLLRNLPQADIIALIGANGVLVNWSRDQPAEALENSARDYFMWLRDHDETKAFIGLPVTGRLTGKRILFIARRINAPDGRFLGVVVGMIDTHFLEGFYGTIGLLDGETVTVLRRDGGLIARYPEMKAPATEQMPAGSPWYDLVSNGGGSFLSPGYFSAVPRIITIHPLRDYGLVVDVNVSEKAALRVWRTQAAAVAFVVVGIAAALAILFGVIIRQFRRQEVQNARLQLGRTALRASERKLKAYAEMAADWFWEQDANLRFVRDSYIPQISVPADVGKTRRELSDPAMDPGRWEIHEAVLAARLPFRDFRWERIGIDGRRHFMSTSGDPIFDEAGTFAGYHGTGRDVTADVEIAEMLREAKDRAEAASHAKSEFLRNVSHELRTPLHAIIGFSELMRDRASGPLNDVYREWAGEIHESGRSLLGQINDVLDLSRIDTDRYEISDDNVDLEIVARACRGLVRQQAEAKQVRVDCEIAGAIVLADRRAVKQITLNLLTNAVKFTSPGGVVTIRTEPAADGDLALVVADTGIGIDPAVLPLLGEPFTQADTSLRRKYGGTGLGLTISRKLAVMHGGTLTIESVLDQGTIVRVNFPAARVLRTPSYRLAFETPRADGALPGCETVAVRS